MAVDLYLALERMARAVETGQRQHFAIQISVRRHDLRPKTPAPTIRIECGGDALKFDDMSPCSGMGFADDEASRIHTAFLTLNAAPPGAPLLTNQQ